MTADPNPQPDELIDPELAARARAAYRARDVLFGLDPSVEDILIVADWLMTGRCELAMAIDEHRHYLHTNAPSPALTLAPDPAQ